MRGKVSLVGAGPGDPGLITVAGLERIREAHVIVYDRLISRRLLDHARDGAELIDVGKKPGESHDQEAINQLLVDKALAGRRVVRLKGGDPFVFGRGGEEAEAVGAAGIDFEVIPGITSAIAVPAYAGIPVTHRGLARSFAVTTAHEADEPDLPSPAQGREPALSGRGGAGEETKGPGGEGLPSADTLVFLMGVKTLPETVRKLTENGRSPETPVAVIRWGTTPEQQTITGTLADIVDRVREAGLTSPAVTIVGEVVRLRETISWFESKPLFGKRVLITRTRKQASTLARLLADEGAIPIELPAIEIQPSHDEAALDAAIKALGEGGYAWTIFTSANAVDIWMGLVQEGGYDARLFGHTNVAAIGPATAQRLAGYGIIPDLVPREYVAEAIVEELGKRFRPGKRPIFFSLEDANDEEAVDAFARALSQETVVTRREEAASGDEGKAMRVLVPRAEGARPELIEGLRALGVEVDEVTLYRAAVPTDAPAEALEMLRNGEIDIVTFTASSTVRNLVAMLNGSIEALTGDSPLTAHGEGPGVRSLPMIACIGPITAATARELGLRVDVEAAEHTVEGLVAALTGLATGQGAAK